MPRQPRKISDARDKPYRRPSSRRVAGAHEQTPPSIESQTRALLREFEARVTSTVSEELTKCVMAAMRPRRAEPITEATSTATQEPLYPKTSLLGLPAEIRLMVYDVLWETALVHVHARTASGELRQSAFAKGHRWFEERKFTWTPCLAVNTQSRCLCAHPVWDGTAREENRCSDLPSSLNRPTGIFALRWACKKLRRELGSSHQHKAAVSLENGSLVRFTRTTSATALNAITHLRLSGDRYKYNGRDDSNAARRQFMLSIPFGSRNPYAEIAETFPRLKTVALQGFLHEIQAQPVLAAIRGEVIGRLDLRYLDRIKKMFTSFNRRTTVILDISYRPRGHQELDGLADIERFIVTRPGVGSDDVSDEHEWTTCEIRCVPFAQEIRQALSQVQ